MAFLAGLGLVVLAVLPDFNRIYDASSTWQHFWSGVAIVSGLALAFLELRHSGEANRFRAEANGYRSEANRLRLENNALQRETLTLQTEVHQLQESIERKLTKVRLYPRVHKAIRSVELSVANLSAFDLWINQVRLIVTNADDTTQKRVVGGATRIARGHTDTGYGLYGSLVSLNGNRTDRLDMKFHIEVEAMGVADRPVTVDSPRYHLIVLDGNVTTLDPLKWST
jgi:hypothetical protein